MDTLTHAALGGLVVCALPTKRFRKNRDQVSQFNIFRCVVVAAVFPDSDYLLFWFDPYQFITDWHRGLTHSIVMIPLWAALLGRCLSYVFNRRTQWKQFSMWCAFGLFSHICVDFVTLYGTKVLAPLDEHRFTLGMFFDVDPYIAVLSIGFMVSGYRNPTVCRYGLVCLILFLIFQQVMRTKAISVAAEQKCEGALNISAVPQPISPTHWKLVISYADYYEIAYINMFSILPWQWIAKRTGIGTMFQSFKPPKVLEWQQIYRFGEAQADRDLAKNAWQAPGFSAFRQFSRMPVLYRIDRAPESTCVWFTDLRYVMPAITPAFRYGLCDFSQKGDWSIYRLKRFSDNARQPV